MSEEKLMMYEKCFSNGDVQYRYGESWVYIQLLIDGGFPTKEEAIAAWDEYVERRYWDGRDS